ncbi:MAG: type II secretion system F family protein [Methanosarcinales archaeon]|nr:type II secretion system F family protein [Methanosarcinales archaeon]
MAQAMDDMKNELRTEEEAESKKGFDLDDYSRKLKFFIHKVMMIPFILLGETMKDQEEKYAGLAKSLKQARIGKSYEMYLSNTIFYSILAGIVGALFGLFIAFILISVIGLPDKITKLTFDPSIAWILDFKELIVGGLIFVFLSLAFGGAVYILFLLYPAIIVGERKGAIDRNLPPAVSFMYAMSRSGMNVIEILRSVSQSRFTYGEVSKEVDVILRDMEFFGNDLRMALHNSSELTPSNNFQDLMYNLLTVIDSGGDIPFYFRDKAEVYAQRAKFEQKGFLETLALIAESYVTAFVAGPLFIIIMGVMMSVMGSDTMIMLQAIVYMMLPVGSFMFIFMIGIMTPGATGEPPVLPVPKLFPVKVDLPPEDDPDYERIKALLKSKSTLAFRQVLRDPLKNMKEKPVNILMITGPIAFIFLILSMFKALQAPDFIDFIDDRIVYAIYMLIVPLAIFHESKRFKEKKIQSAIPDFLKKLASTNQTGMSLRDSIGLMARSKIGYLSNHIRTVWKDMDWGLDVNSSLYRFSNRVRTHTVVRAITLISKANSSSGEVGEVLMIAANDALFEQDMNKERSVNMLIYIVIIYISFAVFIGVVYVISTTFLTEMSNAAQQMEASGMQGGGFMQAFDLNIFNRLFFHAAVVQGVCSGFIAGVMGEGSLLSGMKHATIMLTLGYLLFTLAVL